MVTRVAIVGGGIGGLTLAAALDPLRFETVVYEAQPERATTGAGIGMWASALRALRKIGAAKAIESIGRRPEVGHLFDIQGRTLAKAKVGPLMVLRPALLTALRDAVPASVRFETAEISDPRTLDADVVVGADGVRSVVRGLVQPSAAARQETPWVALRGLADRAPAPADIGEYWGDDQLFGVVPLPEGRTYWFTSQPSTLGPEPLAVDEVLAEARAGFASAAPLVRRTLAEADPTTTLATRIWIAPPMRRYVNGRYVVLGDAAHAMAPNLGRGGCEAIIDAVSLAAALRSDRLGLWQARRLPPTQAARVASGLLMRTALADAPRRNRLIRTITRAS